ncbi:HupE/UreJ family protein [Algivirga pacifica]|uniref:HupE/UreJ family protein n=1 Tax=Algivirga pacifica TaxID=1162670 RepID=A0ABP9D4X4_9BACT
MKQTSPLLHLFSLIILLLITSISLSDAHELRPAYLHITQSNDSTYKVMWKVPRKGDMVLRLQPVFAPSFQLQASAVPQAIEGALLYTYELKGSTPLMGTTLHIDQLDKTMVDVLVNATFLNGENITLLLNPKQTSALLPSSPNSKEVIYNYSILGIEHIWEGIDHLLFVLALMIITKGFSKILKTITAFTIAHSITLSLATLGWVSIPGPPVEATIALSIVFLAVEILKNKEGKSTLSSRKPWLVAFSFGLLHGFGFAGALSEVGVPQSAIPLALAFFNIGVELGQIAFVIVVLAGIKLLLLYKHWPVYLQKVPAYGIGIMASFWLVERVINFW